MKPLRPNPKPGVYGYLAGWTADAALEEKRLALKAFAAQEGYALVHIYEEHGEGGPALAAVIEVTRTTEAPALLVHALSDLGSTTAAQRAVKRRLRAEAGVPVILVVGPSTTTDARVFAVVTTPAR
jgi:hypothetical protein